MLQFTIYAYRLAHSQGSATGVGRIATVAANAVRWIKRWITNCVEGLKDLCTYEEMDFVKGQRGSSPPEDRHFRQNELNLLVWQTKLQAHVIKQVPYVQCATIYKFCGSGMTAVSTQISGLSFVLFSPWSRLWW